MNRRSRLRRHLQDAWVSTIDQQYTEQLVNSEHGLQVYFCMALLREFEESGVSRRLFIEPRLCAKGGQPRFPDVVICNKSHVIGIVELKYTPRVQPKTSKDLETLSFAAKHGPDLTIANQRFLGKASKPREYPLAADAVLCWAGVYAGQRFSLEKDIEGSLAGRFLQLDAVTSTDGLPEKFVGGKRIS